MRRPSGTLFLAVLSVAAWGAPVQLPVADAQPSLGQPNAQRLRITVTQTAITVKPIRGAGAKKVTTLDDWGVPASDQRGRTISSLAAAIVAPDNGKTDAAVDGWAELWIDKAAPLDLVGRVITTLGHGLAKVAIGVKTRGGERTLDVIIPEDLSQADAILTVNLDDHDLVMGAGSAPVKTARRSLATLKPVVASFEKKEGKGRVARRAVLGKWECVDGSGNALEAARCWHGRVVFAGDDHAVWGEVVPLAVAAQGTVPDIAFAVI